MRPDLADVRLADCVFAPHYASPMPRLLIAATDLKEAPGLESNVIARLKKGDVFEVLELSGSTAWGVAPRTGLVGYVEADALGEEPAP